MTRAWLAAGVLFVMVVGTANSGGYRFGASDQAFYIPAAALSADASLFPRDSEVFGPQMRLWVGDELLGTLLRMTGAELSTLFALLYAITMIALAAAFVWLARSLGCSWWTVALCLVLITLRHRIARTGANSLEGYMHPRMLAFACGLAALAFATRTRPIAAAAWTIVAGVIHTSTALWFAGAVAVAALWPYRTQRYMPVGAGVALVLGAASMAAAVAWLPRMDAGWLGVLADRDYLFSADWPAYAWLTNLAYPAVILALHRRRRRLGVAVAGEDGLVAGLMALVAVFLLSIPLAELHVAFFVQLQANRVFWLLDAVTAVYVAWWIATDLTGRWPATRRALLVGLFAALAIGRGVFVLHETGRPLFRLAPADDAWMATMRWLGRQPSSWHVLAHPAHARLHGISVRAAAFRDTPLESGKDPAMAMYDRSLARRVAARTAMLGDFDNWRTTDQVRQVARELDIDVFVDATGRAFDLPVLFRNSHFVVYDLR